MSNQIRRKLDKELSDIHFSSEQQVIERMKKKSWTDKWIDFWNKEITVPLVPVTGATIILFTAITLYPVISNEDSPTTPSQNYPIMDRIIEKGGSYYWESNFNEVKKYED